eukprot:2641402-Prymnesium_polylepis.1
MGHRPSCVPVVSPRSRSSKVSSEHASITPDLTPLAKLNQSAPNGVRFARALLRCGRRGASQPIRGPAAASAVAPATAARLAPAAPVQAANARRGPAPVQAASARRGKQEHTA